MISSLSNLWWRLQSKKSLQRRGKRLQNELNAYAHKIRHRGFGSTREGICALCGDYYSPIPFLSTRYSLEPRITLCEKCLNHISKQKREISRTQDIWKNLIVSD